MSLCSNQLCYSNDKVKTQEALHSSNLMKNGQWNTRVIKHISIQHLIKLFILHSLQSMNTFKFPFSQCKFLSCSLWTLVELISFYAYFIGMYERFLPQGFGFNPALFENLSFGLVSTGTTRKTAVRCVVSSHMTRAIAAWSRTPADIHSS